MAAPSSPRPLVGRFAGRGNRVTDADDALLAIIRTTRAQFDADRRAGTALSPPAWQDADLAIVRHGERHAGVVSSYRKELVCGDGGRAAVLVFVATAHPVDTDHGIAADTERHTGEPGESDAPWVAYAVDLSAPHVPWPAPDAIDGADDDTPLVAALVRDRDRVLSMLDSTDVLIWAVDHDLRFLEGNAAYHAVQTEISGRTVRVGDGMQDVARDGEVWTLWSEWYRRALAGETFSVRRTPAPLTQRFEYNFAPMTDAAGSTVGVVVVGTDVTAQVAAETALSDGEARFRSTFANVADLAFIVDERWRVVFVSDAAEQILGVPHHEVLGERPWAIGSADLAEPSMRALIDELGEPGSHATIRFRYQHPDGRDRWFEVDFVNLLHDPAVRGYAANLHDVTVERAREDQLATSESLLRIASRLGQIAGWVVELPARRLQLSKEAVDMLDLGELPMISEGGAPGLDEALQFYPPATQAVLGPVYDRAIADGEPFDVTVEAVTPTGRSCWLRVLCEPQRGPDGSIVRLDGALADVTESRRREQRLVDQAQLLDTATEGIVSYTWDGTVTYWNRAAERLYGWPSERAIGRHIADLVDGAAPDRYVRFDEHREQLLREGTLVRRVENTNSDGAEFVIELHSNVLYDDDGRPRAALSIATDLTDRIDLERRLALSQKLEAIGQLTGGLAHDFNNLLTVIVGGTEVLAEAVADDEPLARMAATVLEAAQLGAEVTSRLLAFARQQQLQPIVVAPGQVMHGMQQLLRRTLAGAVELEFAIDPELWNVRVDAGQLETALMNVAINARDAMPEGGRLVIAADNVVVDGNTAVRWGDVAPGEHVRIAVTDTGTGVEPDVLANMFDPFFTTKQPGRGSGLGLSMVYGFIKQSGGHVEAASELGHGTTIAMHLPRSASEVDVRDVPAAGSGPGVGSERILVVEDDPLVRALAARALVSLGYEVVEAASGVAALAVLAAGSDGGEAFDLVFTDIVMPGGVDGVELAERAAGLGSEAAVLFTSGYHEVGADSFRPGAELLVKPYRRADLAAAVRRALDRRQPLD